MLIEGGDKLYRFEQVLVLFHIEAIGVKGDHYNFGFLKILK